MTAGPVTMPSSAGFSVDNGQAFLPSQLDFSGNNVMVDPQLQFLHNSDPNGRRLGLGDLSYDGQMQMAFFSQLPPGVAERSVDPNDTVDSSTVASSNTSHITSSSRTTSFASSLEPTTSTKHRKPEPPPSKRRTATRKPKQQEKQQQQHARTKSELAQENPNGSRRSKCLERNRVAASKCRQKKKEWVHELEDTKDELEAHNYTLQREYNKLLDEVTIIKNQLTAHANCNDPKISSWIEAEAIKFVQKSTREDGSRSHWAMFSRPIVGRNDPDVMASPRDSIGSSMFSPTHEAEDNVNYDLMADDMFNDGII